ncbi:protein-glutamine gamma-glutamyltransferase [mine drainage metagenome]|uniref:Protein-glutamine gamma-glutamyltransferase n=1 Tax=mine drainage metagenome TaxID=410659 RepID=A0A1J5RC03_9ZZZZ
MNDHRLTPAHLRLLLASLALVYGLHVLHLPPWVTLLTVGAGVWRYAASVTQVALPKTRWLLPIAAAATLGIIASHDGLFGRNASVSLLAAMMALKLLESHTRRDAMLLVLLAYFFSITGFLFSQSLLVGAYLVLPVVALTATLININHPNGSLPVRFLLRLAGLMLGQSIPIMLALFLLFPRVQGPLWGVPEGAHRGMTGLSDHMSPGSISQLSQSDSVAFRARFNGDMPRTSRLYWRGPVFWHYDGTRWSSGEQVRGVPLQPLQATSEPVSYSVTLEPQNRTWLFMLDAPASIPPNSLLGNDYQLLARQPVLNRVRYEGRSFLQYRMDETLAPGIRAQALQLPRAGNPRTRALGASLAGNQGTDAGIVQGALMLLREQPFRYTLTPPRLGKNAVDEFLFTTRSGFCEHYAGSFVFLMRAAGVPARVVTGYQGGEFNPTGHYLLVRQADAHAWAEVWLQGRGWVRIDPTAAVAPQRIETGLASALPAGEPLPPLMRADLDWLRQLYLRWDAVNNGWNQWVLGYDQQRQMELLSRLAGSRISSQEMIWGLMIGVGCSILAVAAAMLSRGRPMNSLQTSYGRFCRKMARAGVAHQPCEGPLDYGQRAAQALPAQAAEITAITTRYAVLRYGMAPTWQQIEAFRQLVRKFSP